MISSLDDRFFHNIEARSSLSISSSISDSQDFEIVKHSLEHLDNPNINSNQYNTRKKKFYHKK